ncbi:MAG: carbohydrate ABC transporter permease [Actinobacteria bacterium]|nr:carbohydrate ABC transporter permease [Actinomycetota bacterium]
MRKQSLSVGRYTSVIAGKFFSRFYIIMFVVMILFPLLWMFSLSLRYPNELNQAWGFLIPKNPTLSNYPRALDQFAGRGYPLLQVMGNSSIVTISSVILTIIIAALSAYALSRFKFKGKQTIFYLTLLGMMIPIQVVLIPNFLFIKWMGLFNTLWSVILPYTAFGLPIAVFILRGFFNEIPHDLIDAAKIDGASEFGVFLRIVLPLSKPALATCVIFLFLQNWNEFVLALTLLYQKRMLTIPVAISKLAGEFIFPWEIYSASVFITALPIIIVFVIFQNWFIKGITAGAIKG